MQPNAQFAGRVKGGPIPYSSGPAVSRYRYHCTVPYGAAVYSAAIPHAALCTAAARQATHFPVVHHRNPRPRTRDIPRYLSAARRGREINCARLAPAPSVPFGLSFEALLIRTQVRAQQQRWRNTASTGTKVCHRAPIRMSTGNHTRDFRADDSFLRPTQDADSLTQLAGCTDCVDRFWDCAVLSDCLARKQCLADAIPHRTTLRTTLDLLTEPDLACSFYFSSAYLS